MNSLRFLDTLSVLVQAQCRAGDLLGMQYSVIQSACYYLDWNKSWREIYNSGIQPSGCRRLRDDGSDSRLLGAEASLWSERVC